MVASGLVPDGRKISLLWRARLLPCRKNFAVWRARLLPCRKNFAVWRARLPACRKNLAVWRARLPACRNFSVVQERNWRAALLSSRMFQNFRSCGSTTLQLTTKFSVKLEGCSPEQPNLFKFFGRAGARPSKLIGTSGNVPSRNVIFVTVKSKMAKMVGK